MNNPKPREKKVPAPYNGGVSCPFCGQENILKSGNPSRSCSHLLETTWGGSFEEVFCIFSGEVPHFSREEKKLWRTLVRHAPRVLYWGHDGECLGDLQDEKILEIAKKVWAGRPLGQLEKPLYPFYPEDEEEEEEMGGLFTEVPPEGLGRLNKYETEGDLLDALIGPRYYSGFGIASFEEWGILEGSLYLIYESGSGRTRYPLFFDGERFVRIVAPHFTEYVTDGKGTHLRRKKEFLQEALEELKRLRARHRLWVRALQVAEACKEFTRAMHSSCESEWKRAEARFQNRMREIVG